MTGSDFAAGISGRNVDTRPHPLGGREGGGPGSLPSLISSRGLPAAAGPASLMLRPKTRPGALALAAVLKRISQSWPGGA